MARDSQPYVQPAIIATLKSAATVTVLVPAERVYPRQRPPQPTWPFIAYGSPASESFRASGLDGSTIRVAVHAYAETTGSGPATVAGEDMADAIARVVAAVLDGATLDLPALADCPYPATAHVTWTGTQTIQDGGDASAFHSIISLEIVVSSEGD